VRHLTPRAPQLPVLDVHPPRPDPPTSRWRAGPTTFGPLGRLALTAVVLAFAPWQGLTGFGGPAGALTLWWLLGWSFLAVLVLRHVWRRELVLDPDREGSPVRERMTRRFPRLGRSIRIPPLVVLGLLALVVGTVVVVVWTTSDSSGRYYLVAIAVAGGTAVFLALWNDL
jgi:hypothetical protein